MFHKILITKVIDLIIFYILYTQASHSIKDNKKPKITVLNIKKGGLLMARNNNIYYNEDRYKIEEANKIEALENIVENNAKTKELIVNRSNKTLSKKMNEFI